MIDPVNHDPRIATLVIEIGNAQPVIEMTERSAINYILAAMRGGPNEALRIAFDRMRSVASYRRLIKHGAKSKAIPPEFRERFHTAWTTEGFRWRDAVGNDALLTRALRAVLSPYEGQGITLFRGEQASRYDAGRVGFNWTPDRKVAEMFASGLCSTYEGGGVLLTARAPANAIIASPGVHSKHLGENEFIVESSLLNDVTELARHPMKSDG